MTGICRECEFCFPDNNGFVCASHDGIYGEDITDTIEMKKDCYSEGLEAFIKRSQRETLVFIPGTKLSQLKIDGRKQIELMDKNGKIIRIKGAKAKELFGEIEIERIEIDMYMVRAVFDPSIFNGSNYIVVK